MTDGDATGFSADWLRQREPFDLAARSPSLSAGLRQALGARATPWRITDLASGSGANFRALAPVLAGDQTWRLIDHDPRLLAAQRIEIGQWAARHGWRSEVWGEGLHIDTGQVRWVVHGERIDLARQLEAIDLIDVDAVVTTAFLDLVSAPWLDRLTAWLTATPRPFLATLNVDGRRTWQPARPHDALIADAFLAHQGGDKGFGPSLGVHAVPALAERLAAPFQVHTQHSDWHIGPAHRAMLLTLADEAARAARETTPDEQGRVDAWHDTRLTDLAQGRLALTVGHWDLLAVPRS